MFYTFDPLWSGTCDKAVAQILDHPGAFGLTKETFGLVALREDTKRPAGYVLNGSWQCYPCSVVKAFHLVHALHRLEEGTICAPDDLDQAIIDMIRWSSNTATNYVIDFLTGTTGDTVLGQAELEAYRRKRQGLNRYFAALGWPEWDGCNIAMKLSGDTRYGREAQLAGANGENLNRLTPLVGARLFFDLFAGNLPLSRASAKKAKQILLRDRTSLDADNPLFQVADFLGGGMPSDAKIWSKAGHTGWTGDPRTSYFRHDLIRVAVPDAKPIILSMMTQGPLMAEYGNELFPQIGRILLSNLLDASDAH
ncbi:serine hydrolase [Sulfitobacter sp. S0837]|uniref:serine hydrolase n=1 Tax=Sulfitobacter maritimus TaxID=2741719 RepID=UPI00158429EE|nr:serine hydrolase [Sulfitobacter maritimus]NUH63749.1 serine hydrolase [Sulfitobacter maritimus]NUH63777.1 serine hydrolase [Sulfitobacter maritimus]NUH65596.1 serine hydrolase [Sulfitobacter maritimus]